MLKAHVKIFASIIANGGLAEFFEIHYELTNHVESPVIVKKFGLHPAVSFLDDSERIELCSCSVRRLCAWQKEKKTTNDLGYGSSLYGVETEKLLSICMDYADDKSFVRRELANSIDSISNADLREVANRLRLRLRGSL